MRKTTIELTDEQYFYLMEKVLSLRKERKTASMGAIIRQLIDKDMESEKEGNPK